MEKMILEYLKLALVLAVSVGWALFWVKTYDPYTVGGLIGHSVLFSVLSLILLLTGLNILFSPADDSYSASNKSALGMIGLLYSGVFLIGCLIAFIQTISEYIEYKHKK